MRQSQQTVTAGWCVEDAAEFISSVRHSAKREAVRLNARRPFIRIVAGSASIRAMGLPIALREGAARAATPAARSSRTVDNARIGTAIGALRHVVRKGAEHILRVALQRDSSAVL